MSTPQPLEGLALIAMGTFAAVGFGRGARREWISLASAAAAYLAVEKRWPTIAAWLERFRGFVVPARLEGAGVPGVSGAAQGCSGTELPGCGSTVWQIGFFVVVVLAGYILSQRVGRSSIGGIAALVRLPDLVDRLVGAALGAGTGYVTATFLLARLLPEAEIQLTGARSLAAGSLGRMGPPGVFALVGLLILFGVVGLESRGKRVYG